MEPRRAALLIASNEICYNPRLLKMADSLIARGMDVFVFSPIVGLAAPDLYAGCVASRSWTVHSVDLSKRSSDAWWRWAVASGMSRAALRAWSIAGVGVWFHLGLNRSLTLFPWGRRRFDLIGVNLVDNLPMAARLARRHGSVLVYDSQELFSGEGSTIANGERARWVARAERDHIQSADVVTTTTLALANRLASTFRLRRTPLRLRNAPLDAPAAPPSDTGTARAIHGPLQLVWHGFQIHLVGRGVDILLQAIAQCRQPVRLTLQGRLSDTERERILAECRRLQIASAIRFAPPAHPEAIPASLVGYDAGVIAETGIDENQRLTSSNKLFECIHAGLPVIAPDLPGLAETVAAEQVGVLYTAADPAALAEAIDRLSLDAVARRQFARRSAEAAREITWSRDFIPVWAEIEHALARAADPAPAQAMRVASL